MFHTVRRALTLAAAVLATAGAIVLPAPAYADPGAFDPYGTLDSVTRTKHEIEVRGTAHDPDATAALTVAIMVDGHVVTYAGTDTSGGFDATFLSSFTAGEHNVCAEAYNQGAGANTWLGCGGYTVPQPVGAPNVTLRAVSATEVVVEWVPADANATSFRVERSFGGTWSTAATLDADARSWTESGLTTGTPVCFNIVAVNDFSEQGAGDCATSLKPALPIVPYEQVEISSITETSATIRWTDTSIATGYVVDLTDRHTGGSILIPVERDGPGPYEVTVTGLRPLTDYLVHVRPTHPEHETSSGHYPIDGAIWTLSYPELVSVAVVPSTSVGCTVGRQLVVLGQFAERVEIRRGNVVVARGPGNTSTPVVYNLLFGDMSTYTAVAISAAGTEVSQDISVRKDTRATLAKEITITNTRDTSLDIYLYTSESNSPYWLSWVPAHYTRTIPIPHGVVGIIQVKDFDEVEYTMGYAVMGHCGGPTIPITM